MCTFLTIETASKNCSVAVFKKNHLVAYKEDVDENFSHAEKLTLFIQDVLLQSNIEFSCLSAIGIGQGPGSYTGLRIGTSVAKGLSYSLEIPLISVSTLQAMAFMISQNHKADLYCPMIDARRMEVYSAFYNINNQEVRGIQADIIDSKSYKDFLQKKVLFFGDGSAKYKKVVNHQNASFLDGIFPSATAMGTFVSEAYIQKKFEDVAYFEPFYLKDFVAGKKS